ncbi:hypothetical protein [Viridibacillus arvi]|uniref:hypothetical protein n=1 Tax=Viridibacillus arvi TaxID=263475 RepID=UPI003D2DBD57
MVQKKSKSVKFTELKDAKQLNLICRQFLSERNLQPKSLVQNTFRLEDFEKHHLTIPTLNVYSNSLEDFLESVINQPAYFYGRSNDITYPINVMQIESLSENGKFKIKIDEELIDFNYKIQYGEKDHNLVIENTLTISFSLDSNSAKFHISDPITIRSFKKTLMLLKKSKNENELVLFDGEVIFGKPKSSIFNNLDFILEQINQIEFIFNFLGIPLDYQFEGSTSLSSIFDNLIKIFIDHDISMLNLNKQYGNGPSIIKFTIIDQQNLFLVYDVRMKEKFANVFSKYTLNEIVVSVDDNLEGSRISLFCTTDPSELIEFLNFDISLVIKSFENPFHMVNSNTINHSTHFGLDCLKAFDRMPDKALLLDIAEKVFYEEVSSNLENKTFSYLNLYQTKIRKREILNKVEQENLITIKHESILLSDYSTVIACSILAGTMDEANFYLNKLTLDEKEEFYKYPIFNLFKNRKDKKLSN